MSVRAAAAATLVCRSPAPPELPSPLPRVGPGRGCASALCAGRAPSGQRGRRALREARSPPPHRGLGSPRPGSRGSGRPAQPAPAPLPATPYCLPGRAGGRPGGGGWGAGSPAHARRPRLPLRGGSGRAVGPRPAERGAGARAVLAFPPRVPLLQPAWVRGDGGTTPAPSSR